MSSTKAQAIQTFLGLAAKEKGVTESNDNSGTRVEQYQAATTLGGTHWPWCSAYECFVLKETEKATGLDIPWSFSASVDVIWADGRSRGLMHSTPAVGDFFIVKAKKQTGYSTADGIHTGIVTGVNGNTFTTLEGNTNNDGGREGVAVMAHTRVNSDRYAFIRWIDGVLIEAPEKPYVVSVVNGAISTVVKAVLIGGSNYIPARDFANALRVSCTWNADEGEVVLAGKPVAAQPRMIDGSAYFPIRVLADHAGKVVEVNVAKRTVIIS